MCVRCCGLCAGTLAPPAPALLRHPARFERSRVHASTASASRDTPLRSRPTDINVDEGWFIARNATGGMVEDLKKFPEGMRGFGDWVRAQERAPGKFFKYGLYSCRGTCQCSEPDYSGPGSQGFEKQDTDWMVAAGATYLKVSSSQRAGANAVSA